MITNWNPHKNSFSISLHKILNNQNIINRFATVSLICGCEPNHAVCLCFAMCTQSVRPGPHLYSATHITSLHCSDRLMQGYLSQSFPRLRLVSWHHCPSLIGQFRLVDDSYLAGFLLTPLNHTFTYAATWYRTTLLDNGHFFRIF